LLRSSYYYVKRLFIDLSQLMEFLRKSFSG
jgi:hypothetical protein